MIGETVVFENKVVKDVNGRWLLQVFYVEGNTSFNYDLFHILNGHYMLDTMLSSLKRNLDNCRKFYTTGNNKNKSIEDLATLSTYTVELQYK